MPFVESRLFQPWKMRAGTARSVPWTLGFQLEPGIVGYFQQLVISTHFENLRHFGFDGVSNPRLPVAN